jgi:alcohol dehydrogenase
MTMIAAGTLPLDALIGRVIGLEDLGQALAAMDGPVTAPGMTVARLMPSVRAGVLMVPAARL